MPQIRFSAGEFAVEAFSGGHPIWVTLTHNGNVMAHTVRHAELKDLAYCLDRMITAIRAELPASYKHEVD